MQATTIAGDGLRTHGNITPLSAAVLAGVRGTVIGRELYGPSAPSVRFATFPVRPITAVKRSRVDRDCYGLQSTTSNLPQLRSDVLIEEVSTAAKRLRGLARGQRQAQWAGNMIWLRHRLLQSPGG